MKLPLLHRKAARAGVPPRTAERARRGAAISAPARPSFRDMMTPAPDPRARSPRRPIDMRIALTRSALVLCGLVAGSALFSSPLLYVRRVRVVGSVGLLPAERAATAAAVRLPPRSNLLRISPRRIEKAVCRLPWVASASISRRLPGTVRIAVRPRRPIAVMATPAGSFELDTSGLTIRQSVSAPPVPEIDMAAPPAPHPGMVLADTGTQSALVAARWAMGRTTCRISKIVVDQSADLCLNTVDDVTVQLGQPDDLDGKLSLLAHIYDLDPGIGARVSDINLMYPKAPACTPRGVRQGASVPLPVGTAAGGGERGTGGQQPDDQRTGGVRRTP